MGSTYLRAITDLFFRYKYKIPYILGTNDHQIRALVVTNHNRNRKIEKTRYHDGLLIQVETSMMCIY